MGNRHKKSSEDRTCSSEDMIEDRQTHTHTERRTHHHTPLPYRRRSNKPFEYKFRARTSVVLQASTQNVLVRTILVHPAHYAFLTITLCSVAVLDPMVGYTMDVLSPFTSLSL